MKNRNLFRKLAAFTMAGALALGLCACGGSNANGSSDTPSAISDESENAESETNDSDNGKAFKVAIVRLITNDAFIEMGDGFTAKLDELTNGNVTYDIKDAAGDMATLNTIAADLKNSDYDLVCAIATPAAQAIVNASLLAPTVFISVSDPIGAGIMSDMAKPDKNATGTSNSIPVDKLIDFAKELTPNMSKIGVLHSSGEKNSVLTATKAMEYFDSIGLDYEEKTMSTSNEVQQAAQSLAENVDAIYVTNDSVVQSAMPQVVEAADAKGIPVYGSDPVMVQSGCLACVSVSNTYLGNRSAEMAFDILGGKDVSDVPAELVTDFNYSVNKTTADKLGIALPETYDLIIEE